MPDKTNESDFWKAREEWQDRYRELRRQGKTLDEIRHDDELKARQNRELECASRLGITCGIHG